MRIQILTFDGCPHADQTYELVQRVLSSEGVVSTVEMIDVHDARAAERMRFLGSPSVRIDGEDAEPAARTRSDYGIMCRTYGENAAGMPPTEIIRDAIRRALDR